MEGVRELTKYAPRLTAPDVLMLETPFESPLNIGICE
jgi:hypothetical protein